MKKQFQRHFSQVILLLIPILIGSGCAFFRNEAPPTPTQLPTPKPVPAISPTPTPTLLPETVATPTSAPAPSSQSVSPYHTDDFTDITSGWPNELEFDNYYIGYHEPDWYHVEVHEQNDSAVVVLPGQSLDDFTVEAEVEVSVDNTAASGDFRYGLAVRRSGNRYYAFTISPRTKRWYVLKSSSGGLTVLMEGNDDSIQGLEALDRLRVDADGSIFTFHINDHAVSQINDPDYAGGEVGFFVETFDSPRAHIHYDTLTIREVEASPPPGALYTDDFTDVTSGWPDELVFDNYFVGYHEPDFYHVQVSERNDLAVVVLPEQSFDDFTIETEILVDEDNTAPEGDFRYGLAIRRSGNQYYAFTISPRTKRWYVLKSSPGGLKVLTEGSDGSIQGLEALDKLQVDVMGSKFTFHINDHSVSQINDPDYASGEVGFFVETFDGPRAHIHYDSLTIREVEAPPPLCTVVTRALNLRNGPGIAYNPPIIVLTTGTRLEALARNRDGTWLQARVQGGSQTGWLSAAATYVSCDISVADLPLGETPPLPGQARP